MGGLYAQLQEKYGEKAGTLKGKDFFEYNFFQNSDTRPWFYRFVGELKDKCSTAKPTLTHEYCQGLLEQGKLARWYTQNIDGLEAQSGARLESMEVKDVNKKSSNGSVVLLHGNLDCLVCTLCKHKIPFTPEMQEASKDGEWKACEACTARSDERKSRGRRALQTGFYRPDIVLYGEPHPQSEHIGSIISDDMQRSAGSVLIVMGTSLKVVGIKRMVKDFTRRIKTMEPQANRIFYINKTAPPRTDWKTVFDFEYLGECDEWVRLLTLAEPPKSPSPSAPAMIPSYFSTVKKNLVRKAIKSKDETTADEAKENKKSENDAALKEGLGSPLATRSKCTNMARVK